MGEDSGEEKDNDERVSKCTLPVQVVNVAILILVQYFYDQLLCFIKKLFEHLSSVDVCALLVKIFLSIIKQTISQYRYYGILGKCAWVKQY